MKLNFGKALAIGGVAAFFGLIGAVAAQVGSLPQVVQVNTGDLFQDVVGGAPRAGNVYATAPQISGIEGYSYQVPLTAFAITPGNATSFLYLNPAGTLATGAITMAALPGDGQKFCVEDSQTQTAVTFAANTGQTLASYGLGAVTALTANTKYCWFYIAPQAAWVRTT